MSQGRLIGKISIRGRHANEILSPLHIDQAAVFFKGITSQLRYRVILQHTVGRSGRVKAELDRPSTLDKKSSYSIWRSNGRLQSMAVSPRPEQSKHALPHDRHARPLQVHVLAVVFESPGTRPDPEPDAWFASKA